MVLYCFPLVTPPGRVLTVRYEDLASQPVATAQAMYRFAGISWTSDVERRTLELTQSGDQTFVEHKFDTRRRNSTSTSVKWRTKIDFSTASDMQRRCNIAMAKYGYREAGSVAELRDSSVSLVMPSYDDVFLKP